MKKRNVILPYNPKLKQRARELRKNMTFAEVKLWQRIRRKALGVEFHRQVPIDQFIVDFYCHELLFAIELDGSSHIGKEEYDARRQRRLESLGVQVIRFPNRMVRYQIVEVMSILLENVWNLQREKAREAGKQEEGSG